MRETRRWVPGPAVVVRLHGNKYTTANGSCASAGAERESGACGLVCAPRVRVCSARVVLAPEAARWQREEGACPDVLVLTCSGPRAALGRRFAVEKKKPNSCDQNALNMDFIAGQDLGLKLACEKT